MFGWFKVLWTKYFRFFRGTWAAEWICLHIIRWTTTPAAWCHNRLSLFFSSSLMIRLDHVNISALKQHMYCTCTWTKAKSEVQMSCLLCAVPSLTQHDANVPTRESPTSAAPEDSDLPAQILTVSDLASLKRLVSSEKITGWTISPHLTKPITASWTLNTLHDELLCYGRLFDSALVWHPSTVPYCHSQ